MRLTPLFFILVGIALLAACDSNPELSRDEARELVARTNEYPSERLYPFVFKYVGSLEYADSLSWPSITQPWQEMVEHYQKRGVGSGTITVYEDESGATFFRVDYELDENAKTFLRGEIKNEKRNGGLTSIDTVDVAAFVCDVGEVTGIAYLNAEKTLAQVEYIETITLTPFFNGRTVFEDGTYTANFRLYDDGWRFVGDPRKPACALN